MTVEVMDDGGDISFFFKAEDGVRVVERSRRLGDVYKKQGTHGGKWGADNRTNTPNNPSPKRPLNQGGDHTPPQAVEVAARTRTAENPSLIYI
mgnify:CR=1 FL=1